MDNNRRITANEIFSNILEQKKSNVTTPDEPIVNFENGQPIEVREDVIAPTVDVPEVTPVEQSERGEPVVATEVGAEIQQVDQKIATEVEGQIQSEGGDVQQLEADASTKTELPQGKEELAAKHNNFIRGAGEAATLEASEMEEIWDPLEENQAA